ncbi:hypothetical protein GCM10018779_67800 [Streptomyces griseocarneus]|nr:hypothetical protein GCM10018779_67800 [Streptomyces griseocarneus]
MRLGKPRVTRAEPPCGNRKTREAKAAGAKAQGKTQSPAPQPLRITRRIPVLVTGPEREPTRVWWVLEDTRQQKP